jgi:putative transposase
VRLVDDRPDVLTIAEACASVELPRATYYRARSTAGVGAGRRSHRRLTDPERQRVLETLISERFRDQSVRQVWAQLLDEGTYLCSVRTMYRVLAENRAVRERRDQLRHPEYSRPELLATGPNQLWSWDITKLKGPHTWSCFHLYVVMDVYSRKVVGWLVAGRESATLAVELIRQSCQREGIGRDELTVHADRGSSMRSKPVAFLLADLGVTKTHSRPYTSTDNPYSEAQFKTLKYQPDFPEQFGSIEDARAFLVRFFDWYNNEHRHSGIGLVTPAQRHSGADKVVYGERQVVLAAFYQEHPERFVRGIPSPPELPGEVWINKPDPAAKAA